MDEQIHGWLAGWQERWMHVQMDGCTNGWLYRWMDGESCGGMNE